MSKTTLIILLSSIIFTVFSCKNDPKQKQDETPTTVNFNQTDNKLRIRLPANPDRLNPILTTNGYSRIVFNQLFQSIMNFDPKTMKLIPQIAKSAPAVTEITSGTNKGGVKYTYQIKDDAVWADGSPVTGYDFEFTMKAIFNPKVNSQPFRPYYDFVTDIFVDKKNPKIFSVLTDRKYIVADAVIGTTTLLPKYHYDPEGLMDNFSYRDLHNLKRASILVKKHPELAEFAESFNSTKYSHEPENIVGSGAYQVTEWIEKQRIVLKKKPNWWGNKYADTNPTFAAYPDELIFLPIPDQTTTVTEIKNEKIDLAPMIAPHDFVELRKNKSISNIYDFYTPPSLTSYFIYINNQNPKLSDKKVRRALAHLIDIDELINTAVFGLGKRIVGPISYAAPYFDRELKAIPFDIDKAKALLKEAGWTDSNNNGIVDKVINGETTELSLDYSLTKKSKLGKNIALLFQDNAKKAGIKIEIVTKDFNAYRGDIRNKNYELASGGISIDPVLYDPKPFWHSASNTTNGGNRTGFQSTECDRVIDELRVTLDEQKRNQLYRRFQEIIYDEQPLIFLFSPLNRLIVHKRFEPGIQSFGRGFSPGLFKIKKAPQKQIE